MYRDVNTLISIVIPVYKSEEFLEHTVSNIVRDCEKNGLPFEIILVCDGSPDGVWSVIEKLYSHDKRIIGVALAKNYGQHAANIVGFKYAQGECVITMDDDGQNPSSEILTLVETWRKGHDLVFGKFISKQHGVHRRFGSRVMNKLNSLIFAADKELALTNFRLIDRSVIDRINEYKTLYPYTTGLALMYATNPTDVEVQHDSRAVGQSNYSLKKLVRLAWSIIFNYSKLPIRVTFIMGLVASVVSGIYGFIILISSLIKGVEVAGWASIMVYMAFSNSLLFLFAILISEYLFVLIGEMRHSEYYHVKKASRSVFTK